MKTVTVTAADRVAAAATAAAIEVVLAMPRADRPAVRPIPALLPEIGEAARSLPAGVEFLSTRMADGSGFAEVRSTSPYGVLLSSERYPDHTDRAARLAASRAVARAILDGAL